MGWKVLFGEIRTKEDGEDENGPRFVQYSDTEVDFDDLQPEAFAAIAKDLDVGLTYWGIYRYPNETPEVLYRLVQAAAQVAGVEAPERPTTMREQKALDAMVVRTEDLGDKPVVDGFPQMPGETASGSTSTSPGTTDGLPMSSTVSPSGDS